MKISPYAFTGMFEPQVNKLTSDESKAEWIMKVMEERHQLGSDIFKKTRLPRIVRVRQMAIYLLRKHTNMSLHQLGDMFNLDHTNIVHAIQTVENDRDTNAVYAQELLFIQNKVREQI